MMRRLFGLLAVLFVAPAFAQSYPPTFPIRAEAPGPERGPVTCPSARNPFTNCGFESGLTGWVVTDLAQPYVAVQAVMAGFTPGKGLFAAAPTEGTVAAVHGFDGAGPGQIVLAQDVVLPSDTRAIVFDFRVGWDLVTFCQSCTGTRTMRLQVQPSGGGTALASTTFITAAPGTQSFDSGPRTGTIDVSAFAGQSVRIAFVSDIPENFSGPAFFQLDDVQIALANNVPVASPYGLAALAGVLVLLGLAALRGRVTG